MYFCVYSNQNRGGDKRKFFYMKHFSCLLFLCLLIFQACDQPEPSPIPKLHFRKWLLTRRWPIYCCLLCNKRYCLYGAGRLRLFDLAVNDCWAYYPESNSWARKADFPGLPRVNAVAEVVNGKAFAGLGYHHLIMCILMKPICATGGCTMPKKIPGNVRRIIPVNRLSLPSQVVP